MFLKINEELSLFEKSELSEEEQLAKESELLEFIIKTAEAHSSNKKISLEAKVATNWDQEYRLWLPHSKIQCDIRFQEIDGRVSHLTINHTPYALNDKGVDIFKKWLHGEEGPQASLQGNTFEKVNRSPAKCIEDSYWDDWKQDICIDGTNNNLQSFYTKELYPLVNRYMSRLLSKESSILELCGGDGELAHVILQEHTDAINKYLLVDRNRPSIEIADKTLKKFVENKQAQVFLSDISGMNLDSFLKQKVDIVIGVGALTRTVLERTVATQVFHHISSMIKPGGYILLTGVADQWIDSEMLVEAGFTVKNMMVPSSLQQFYVAQKNHTVG